MITQTLKLNLIPGQVLPRVNVSQYDAGTRTLQMLLYNGDQAFNIPVGYGGFVQGTKPDRTGFQYAATVTEGSNVVTLVITQQMTAVSGEVTCELVIANGNDRIATVNFILYVEPAALADDTVISETELPLIEEAAELAQRIDGIVADVEADADRAEAAVEHYPYIGANGNWYVFDLQTEQFVDTTIAATGPQGPQGDDGPTGPQGPTGPTGNGIVSITKTGTSGLVDTYTILFTDGTTTTFTVTNGQNSTVIQALTNQVKDMNNVLGSKNLLPYPYDQTTKTVSGVTFTDNGDGTITLNGTNTGTNTVFMFCRQTEDKAIELLLELKKMNTSFKLLGGVYNPLVRIMIDFYDSSKTYISSVSNMNDTPTIFTIPSNANSMNIFIRCNDIVYSDLTIYPMLYLASIEDDTYVPYAKSNKELTEDFIPKVLTVTPNDSYVNQDNLHITKYGQLVILSGYFYVHTEAARGAVLYTLPSSVGNFSGNASGLALGNTGSAILLIIGDSNTLKVEAASGIPIGWYSIMMVMLNKTENI